MLRAMRADFKKYSWTLWLVIFAFVGGFIVTDAFRGESKQQRELIYLDGQVAIRGEEYQKQLLRRLQNYKDQFKDNFNQSMINQFRIPEQTLQEMIRMAIILKEAERLNIRVSKKEVGLKITNLPGLQRDGKFVGESYYRQWVEQYLHMNITEFEEEMKKEILGEKFQELVAGSLVIDEPTLQERYKKENDKAELDLILFKPERIKQEIPVEDKDLTAYYEKNKEEFKSRERRAAYIIAYKFDDYKKEAAANPQEIFDHFKLKRSDYRVPGKIKVSRIFLKYGEKDRDEVYKKAEALQQELTKENFAEKAKLLSQDEKASTGGDYGYTGWQNFSKQEKTFIDSLEEGQFSTPIDTQEGYSIVYIPEKIPEKQQNFDEVKDRIKDSLEQEKAQQLVNKKLQNIKDKLGKTDNIKAKAQEMGITAIETEWLTSGQPIKNIDEVGYISRQIFTLGEKEIAFPVQFLKGLAIVQVSKIEAPTVEPFETCKEKVKEKVVTAKKVELLKENAAGISAAVAQVTDDKKVEEFLKKEELTPTPITYKRGNRLAQLPVRKGLDEMVFSMEEKRYSAPLAYGDQVAILKVKSKTITTPAEFDKGKAEFYTKEISQLRNSYFMAYISSKMQTHRLTQNQELFDQIKEWVITRFN